MPCICGESNCFCFEKCVCPVEFCMCILCLNITGDEDSNALPENAYPECSPNNSKTSQYTDKGKAFISPDIDTLRDDLFEDFDGITDELENIYPEYGLNISKTSLRSDKNKSLTSPDVDAHIEHLLEDFDRIVDKLENTCPEYGLNIKTSLHSDKNKSLISPDVDADIENLFDDFDGTGDKQETEHPECSPNIFKTLVYSDWNRTSISPDVDARAKNLFQEIDGTEKDDDILFDGEIKPGSKEDTLQITISSDSDCEIILGTHLDCAIEGRFKNYDEAFDSLLNISKDESMTFPKTIRTYAKNRKKKKKIDLSKYGPWHTFPPSPAIYDIQNESYDPDFPIPLTNDSRKVSLNRSAEPQATINIEQSRRISYSEFSRKIRQSNRSSAVPCRAESNQPREITISSSRETRNFESSTEIYTEPELRASAHSTQLEGTPRRVLLRAPQVMNRHFPTRVDHEASINSRASVYSFNPSEYENNREVSLQRNRSMPCRSRGRKPARPSQTANSASLPEATGTGSKRKRGRKKKRPLCKTRQGDLKSQKEEIRPTVTKQGKCNQD